MSLGGTSLVDDGHRNNENSNECLTNRLKLVEDRIKLHLSKREFEAALILSDDMISIADGKRNQATSPELLPSIKLDVPTPTNEITVFLSRRLTNSQTTIFLVATAFIFVVSILIVCHHTLSVIAYNHLMQSGKCAQARKVVQFESCLESISNASRTTSECSIAETYVCEGQFSTAQVLLGKLLERCPNSGRALGLMAAVQWHQQNISEAEQLYYRGLEFSDVRCWNAKVGDLAVSQFVQGKLRESRETLKLLNLKEPTGTLGTADNALVRGNYKESCVFFEKWFAENLKPINKLDALWRVHQLKLYAQALAGNGELQKSQSINQQASSELTTHLPDALAK